MPVMEEFQKVRVNASMLPSFQGRNVCVIGRAKDIDSNGKSLTLTTSDGKDVRVNMQEPLSDYIGGLVEVHGQVDGRNNITCQTYVKFEDEISNNFNMEMYNTAIELIARAPQHYQQGLNPQST